MALVPTPLDITRVRGDTFPLDFQISVTGGSLDVTGMTFLLTVDPSPDPVNATNNLFELTGTIVDAPNGKIRFSISLVQADQTPSEYYYDLQLKDTLGLLRTIAKGKWTVVQDITKAT